MSYNVTLSELSPALEPDQFCRILEEVQTSRAKHLADPLCIAMTSNRMAFGAHWLLSAFAYKKHKYKVGSKDGFDYYVISKKAIKRFFEDAMEAQQKLAAGGPDGQQARDLFWKEIVDGVPYVYDQITLMKPDVALWHLYVAYLDLRPFDNAWWVIKTNINPANSK